MDLFHNSSGWLRLALRGSCAVPVGSVDGFVMGRGGCLGQTGWKSLSVCANMRVCLVNRRQKWGLLRNDMHDHPLFSWCTPPTYVTATNELM